MKLSDCPCLGRNLDKLVQPAILALLAEEPLHGYALAERIGSMPVCRGEVPNPTGIYRFLTSMERRGLVSSEWDSAERGPNRKVYQITVDGRACLEHWIDALEQYRRGMDALIRLAKRSLADSQM
jgi:DNA-binding PadR family transcriptional regulator